MRNFIKEVIIVVLALIIGICAGAYYENHRLVILGDEWEDEYVYPNYDGPAVEANMQDTLAAIANGETLYEEILYEDILTENTITWDNVPTQEWP